MKKLTIIIPLLLMLLSACREKGIIRDIGTTIEPLVASDDDKVYIDSEERLLYWEVGDKITIYQNGTGTECEMSSVSGVRSASFRGGPFVDNVASYAFYPSNLVTTSQGSDDNGTWTLKLPRTQPYRTAADNAADPDQSFGKGVLPMVAYIASGTIENEVIFHVVGGLLRLQFYGSSLSSEFTIDSILFESKEHNISGSFNIGSNVSYSADCENTYIQSFEPVLTTNSSGSKYLSITDIGKTIGGTGSNQYNLLTFYLPLPVTSATTMTFKLRVTVYGRQGGDLKKVVKVLQAPIHRSNITKMPAVGITELVDASSSGTGNTTSADQMIVGSGTKDRPFQIYTAQELQLVANAMANADGRINGQLIRGTDDAEGPTYFKVVRSDISLLPPGSKEASDPKSAISVVWNHGIQNFRGIMYFASSTVNAGGITNTSGQPLFESISTGGEVREIYVKGDHNVDASENAYSPLCYTNNGTITACHNRCNVTTTSTRGLAGVCVTNNGTISGSTSEGSLSTNGNVGIVCYRNNSGHTISGCYIPSLSIPSGAEIGGICHTNYGTIEDCQVSVNSGSSAASGEWGVIVYNNNNGAVVRNCVSAGVVLRSTNGGIGGIVYNNHGDIDYCRNELPIHAYAGSVGGIVALMDAGYVYNCYTWGGNNIYGSNPGTSYAGGIVGTLSGGHVYNCFNTALVDIAVNNGGIVGLLGYDADVQNCWTAGKESFYGQRGQTANESGGYDFATVGAYCFSRNPSDVGCNIIRKNDYTDSIMVNPSSSEAGNMLSVHLNAGVNDLTDGHTYRTWEQTTDADAPILSSTATTKTSRRRITR